MENKCLVCGAIIPEGRQVCLTCKKGGKHEISKKLTDEEIIKAYFEDCNEDFCHTCPLSETDCCAEILDLIHRQKATIEQQNKEYIELDLELRELRTGLDKELTEHKEFTLKAKAEIERLTEELKYYRGELQ